jgi:hypothetical protein
MPKSTRSTLKDRRLDACSSILGSSRALRIVTKLLEKAGSDGCSKRKATSILKDVMRTTKVAAATLERDATRVNDEPSAMLQYVNNAIEVSKRREFKQKHGHRGSEKEDRSLLNNYVRDNKENLKPASARQKRNPVDQIDPPVMSKRVCLTAGPGTRLRYSGPRTKPTELNDIDAPPPPSNGCEYTPLEVATILLGVTKDTSRTALRKYWREKGLVSVSDRTLKRVCTNMTKGLQIQTGWHHHGRPRAMAVAEVMSFGDLLVKSYPGRVVTGKTWQKALIEKQKKEAIYRGVHPELTTVMPMSFSTAERYLLLHRELATMGTAAGQSAPLYIVVSGLSEEEMPKEHSPEGFFPMEISSLTIGGTVDPNNTGKGYIVFI